MISLRSKITQAVLNYFFLNDTEELYVNELQSTLLLDKRNLVKKLNELQREGILQSKMRGNLKLYALNKKYPFLSEYKKIVLKQTGFEQKVGKMLEHVKGAKTAIIFGSYANGTMDNRSDVDLMVIGNHKVLDVQRKMNSIQKEINREINVIHMDEKEFLSRKKKKEPLVTDILKKKYIKIDV
ncbi:nucleotidyltransferase domain-containing protein [bacterium]|nr:nucleotidyltransferase domain-containing protein [bacterium]